MSESDMKARLISSGILGHYPILDFNESHYVLFSSTISSKALEYVVGFNREKVVRMS